MQNEYIFEAQMIDNQTIHINEPLNLDIKDVIVTIQPIQKTQIKKSLVREKYKNKIWMSPDFNEPLDDFKEYME